MFVLADGANATAVGARTAAARMLSLVIFILECKLICVGSFTDLLMDMRREVLPSMLFICGALAQWKSASSEKAECVHLRVPFRGDEKIL